MTLKQKKTKAGFTLIELIVALTLLTMITLFGWQIYINYIDSARNLRAANIVYQEGRILMEKIVREVRQNGIDYEEYFNQNVLTGELGDNYCLYDQDFYAAGFDLQIGTPDDESLGIRNPENDSSFAPLENMAQEDLFLINAFGDQRTYISLIEKEVEGEMIGKVGMVKLVGQDFGSDGINGSDSFNGEGNHNNVCIADERENDGLIDTWHCDPNFPCNTQVPLDSTSIFGCSGFEHQVVNDPLDENHSFIDFSPNAINVVDLKFMAGPQDDPWRAYKVNEVQVQPYVTIQMTIEANPKLVNGSTDAIPRITLTTTATTRHYGEVNSSCI